MRWILITGMLLIAASANANTTTGNKLLNHCNTGEGTGLSSAIPFGTCLGFSSAVMEAMIANGRDERLGGKVDSDADIQRGYMSGWEACFPARTSPGDVRNAAQKFLSAHPGRLESEAVDLVAEALAGAYPCAK